MEKLDDRKFLVLPFAQSLGPNVTEGRKEECLFFLIIVSTSDTSWGTFYFWLQKKDMVEREG